MIRPVDLVSLADLLAHNGQRNGADQPAQPADQPGQPDQPDQPADQTGQPDQPGQPADRPGQPADPRGQPAGRPEPAAWRTGWPAVLASSAARAVLALLAGLLLASTVPALAGWQPTVVQTGSMRPRLQPGDVVVARPVPAARLQPGQVVLVADPDHPGRLRLHRLVGFSPSGSLTLRGDANASQDSSPVSPAALRGVAVLRVPAVGLPMLWLRQGRYLPLGLLGATLAGLLLVANGYRAGEDSAGDSRPNRRGRRGSGRQRFRLARSRLGRPAAVAVLLAGLTGLQLAHPAAAHASLTNTVSNSADSWGAATYFSCRAAVLASSPALYWQLNETSGSSITDSSGAGATGTFTATGVTLRQPGTCSYDGGTAVTLNGSSGYLYRNSKSSTPSTFSWEIWFATTTTRGGWLIGTGSSQTGQSTTTDRQLYLSNSGQVGFGISSGGTKRTVFSTASYNDGAWHLADATFSAGTGMRLYLDGQLVASNATVTSAASYQSYLRVGYDNLTGWTSAPTSFFYAGSIDEVSAYSTVLTATQIGYHYGAGS